MSYDVQLSQDRHRVTRARTVLSAEDRQAIEFLEALDAAPFEVTEWEAQFLASLIRAPRPLSPAQRTKIDQMRQAYEHRLGGRPGQLAVPAPPRLLPPAEKGKCGYFVRAADGRQVRCNAPAAVKNMLGAEYCTDHARARAEATLKLRELRARA